MKKIILLSIILFIGISSLAQPKIYSLSTKDKAKMAMIESKYREVFSFGEDSASAVLHKEEDINLFFENWQRFLSDMGKHLKKNNIIIDERIFLRVFFNEEGGIDYLFYNVINKESSLLNKREKKLFEKALKDYAKTAKININSRERFKQCGAANFQLSKTK